MQSIQDLRFTVYKFLACLVGPSLPLIPSLHQLSTSSHAMMASKKTQFGNPIFKKSEANPTTNQSELRHLKGELFHLVPFKGEISRFLQGRTSISRVPIGVPENLQNIEKGVIDPHRVCVFKVQCIKKFIRIDL